ncbi:unnamed protein product, partial [Amoebophrya sp. A25]
GLVGSFATSPGEKNSHHQLPSLDANATSTTTGSPSVNNKALASPHYNLARNSLSPSTGMARNRGTGTMMSTTTTRELQNLHAGPLLAGVASPGRGGAEEAVSPGSFSKMHYRRTKHHLLEHIDPAHNSAGVAEEQGDTSHSDRPRTASGELQSRARLMK